MNNEQLTNVIKNNYNVIISVDGLNNVQTDYANRFFNPDKEYKKGTIVNVPNHRYACSLIHVFISDETKTVFLALAEVE